jgi:hypothetical protein
MRCPNLARAVTFAVLAVGCTMPNPAYLREERSGGGGADGAVDARGGSRDGAAESAAPGSGGGSDGASGSGGDQGRDGPSAEAPAPDLTTGLIGYWPFDDQVGNIGIPDTSGTGNNGLLVGYEADLAAAWTTGWRGSAIAVTAGSTQGILIPAVASVDQLGPFTFSAWVFRTPVFNNGHTALVSRQLGTGAGEYYNFGFLGDILVLYINGNAGSTLVQASGTTASNAWIHVAASYDGSTVTLYVAGARVAQQSHVASFPSSTNPVYIGNKKDGTALDQAFAGRLDEIAIYNRALPAAAIAALAGRTTPLP